MNCAEYEDRIALYAEGDLRPAEASEVERHLADCPECAEFAAAIGESQAALKLLARATPGPAIRNRVLAAIEARRNRMRWLAAVAALFVIMAAGVVWSLQRTREAPRVARESTPPKAAPRIPAPTPVTAAAVPKRKRRTRTQPKFRTEPEQIARNTEPLVVKMLTDDPDVVIIWLVDGKEQTNEEAPLGLDGPRGE